MAKQTGRGKTWWVTCGIIAAGLIILGLLAGIYLFTPFGKPAPSVYILQPDQSLEIESGQAVVIMARGDSSSGIKQIDFLVDDIPVSQEISVQSQQETLDVAFPWFSSQPGVHKLSVIAIGDNGAASSPDSVLVVVTVKEPQDSSQLDSQGENAINDGGSAVGEEQSNLDQVLLNVDEDGDFPVHQSDDPEDAPPDVTAFDIQIARDGNLVNGNYSIIASDDLGIHHIAFHLSSLEDPLNAISSQTNCDGERTCDGSGVFSLSQGEWILSAQAEDTSGQVSPMRVRQVELVEGADSLAIILDNGDTLIQLDPQVDWGEVHEFDEAVDDIGTPRFTGYECSGQIIVLEVPYTYSSDHGDQVYIGAWAEKGNTMVAAGQTLIEHGSGVARFEMEATAADLVDVTEQLELHFWNSEDGYFYTEMADILITWPVPLPDLIVTDVGLVTGLEDGRVYIDVQNIGCASSLDRFDVVMERSDGSFDTQFFEEQLTPGATKRWSVPTLDPNLYTRAFNVFIDVGDEIAEINEDNNYFEKDGIILKHIHFYKIIIWDTSEDEWYEDASEGEFSLRATVSGEYEDRPRGEDSHWLLPKGAHDIDGFVEPIFISPSPDWNHDLFIGVDLIEDDAVFSHNHDRVEFLHSYDILQENCWKNGGEFSKKSELGIFTIFWRVVVE